MLTRLKASGFKNLIDIDVYFGPFTCIAGANGVGKSNLFDVIEFLSALADHTLVEAASSVRGEGGRTSDIRSLFHRIGNDYAAEISLEAEMIVPYSGLDDLGQEAKASITFLRYALILAYRSDDSLRSSGSLEIRKEELKHINLEDAKAHLPFPHARSWRQSAVRGRRTSPFISTDKEGEQTVIKLHQDGRSGKPLVRSAANLPRTVLSATNAAESPTALLARREMQSWKLLQLEPSSLRKSDDFKAPTSLGVDGSHLPATMVHLAQSSTQGTVRNGSHDVGQVYARVANRLADLIDDVYDVTIDQDQKRELLTVIVTDRHKTPHPARALSDGTLRFMALAVIELDPNARGLLCLEEPENGIHPERIPAMLSLLQDIAFDATEVLETDNPLRQVIINTHSPAVVAQVPEDSLLIAESRESIQGRKRFMHVRFGYLPGTWRVAASGSQNTVSRGSLLPYLHPVAPLDNTDDKEFQPRATRSSPLRGRRVADRPDMQLMLPFVTDHE
jgi:predicted ATPase